MRILEAFTDVEKQGDAVHLVPFGCIHADTDGFHEGLWKDCVKEISQPNTYAIGAGDYLDAVRTHARLALQGYRARGEDQWETQDNWASKAYEDFYKAYLHPIRKKILVMGAGNHLWQYADGTTSDQYLCRLIGCQYGDKPTFLRWHIRYLGRTLKTFKVLVHHEGGGGGGYARHGTDVNAAETKAYQFGAFDIVIFSHTHRKWGLHIPDLDLPTHGALKLVERPRVLIRTGCFTRSYDVKCLTHYAHKKLLPPTELGFVKLTIQFYREYDADKYAKRLERMPPDKARNGAMSEVRYRFKLTY